jgi:hypothetical protein
MELSLDESEWEWMREEYRNYMITSRQEYIRTLENFPESHKKMADLLTSVLGGYAGAKQLFLIANYHICDIKPAVCQ